MEVWHGLGGLGVASLLGDLALCEVDCVGVVSFLGKPGLVWAGGSV